MQVYDETVSVDIQRGEELMSVPFCEIREGDFFPDLQMYVSVGAHFSDDPEYSGWLFYDDLDCAWFPEDFDADLKQ